MTEDIGVVKPKLAYGIFLSNVVNRGGVVFSLPFLFHTILIFTLLCMKDDLLKFAFSGIFLDGSFGTVLCSLLKLSP